MKINGKALFQLFKYSIYGLLTINLYVFFSEEILATRLEFPDGVAAGDFLQAYAATVDTAAWVDVVNAGVWLIVVLLLEVDVRLQEHNMYEGLALFLSTVAKVVLYSILGIAAVIWFVKGDFVDWWDAFLWLVAFIFIEMNVFEWRQESHEAMS